MKEIVMAETILSNRACTTNHSVKNSVLDELCESMSKISALAQVTLCPDFWTYSQKVQYDYLWALSDIIDQAHQLCDKSEIDL